MKRVKRFVNFICFAGLTVIPAVTGNADDVSPEEYHKTDDLGLWVFRLADLLNASPIRDEISLTLDQSRRIARLTDAYFEELEATIAILRTVVQQPQENRNSVMDEVTKRRSQSLQQFDRLALDVLTAQQRERLGQIARRQRVPATPFDRRTETGTGTAG